MRLSTLVTVRWITRRSERLRGSTAALAVNSSVAPDDLTPRLAPGALLSLVPAPVRLSRLLGLLAGG
jgi:hypothetical protein